MAERSPELEQAARAWLEAKMRGDRDAVVAALSGYDGALAIGTDPGEWYAGAGPFAEAHAGSVGFAAEIERLEAHAEGTVGWGASRAVLDFDGDRVTVRLSFVAHRDGDAWRIVQTHGSIGVSD